MNEYDQIQKTGLSYMDVKSVEHIENNILNGNKEISRLIIKAYNSGFKKGIDESVKFMDCVNKGIEYE